MPVAKIDPVETFYSVGSSLVGRMFLFFSAGWVGLLIGRVAAGFWAWEDFVRPNRVLGRVFSDFGLEVAGLALWPVVILVESASASFVLCFAMIVLIPVCFVVFVWSEEPAPLWWLVLVAATSIAPVAADPKSPSILVLVSFLAACGFMGWWLLRKYHPELIEAVGKVVQGDSEESSPSTSSRKAPPGTWPDGVKGFEDEDEDGARKNKRSDK